MENSSKVIESKGFKWLIRDASKIGGCLQDMLGPNERETYNFDILQKYAGKDKAFIDVGAHVGSFALYASKIFGKVYAFEPQEFNFQGLTANIELNKIGNIKAFQSGAGDINTEKEISFRGGGSKIYSGNIPKLPGVEYNSIKIVRLDDQEFDLPVSVIKIDTEGYEEQVLAGADNLIKLYKPVLLLETHEKTYHGEPSLPGQIGRLKKTLDDLGYSYTIAFKSHFGDEHLICIFNK